MSTKREHDAIFTSNNLFWYFSLVLYRNPEVQNCCLRLQNTQGQNVNLLLFACWLSTLGRHMKQQVLNDITVQNWQEHVTKALRKVRQQLKHLPLDASIQHQAKRYKEEVLTLEINTEHVLQDYLYCNYEQFSHPCTPSTSQLSLQ